jgi:hypothetical protein
MGWCCRARSQRRAVLPICIVCRPLCRSASSSLASNVLCCVRGLPSLVDLDFLAPISVALLLTCNFCFRHCSLALDDFPMLHFVVNDHVEQGTTKRKDRYYVLGQSFAPVAELRCGYRYLDLVDGNLVPIVSSRLHVYVVKEPFVDEARSPRAHSESPNVSIIIFLCCRN